MAFVVVVFVFVFVFLHFLQTTDLYLIQDNVWGIWHRIELNDSTFEQQNKWSMQLLGRLQPRSLVPKNFILHACFTFALRLLLADPDHGHRDLDSCNPILLLKVICMLSHKTSEGCFILKIGASFCGVQQHFETKVVDR